MGEAPAVPAWVIVRIASKLSNALTNHCTYSTTHKPSHSPTNSRAKSREPGEASPIWTISKTLAEAISTSTSPAIPFSTTAIANHGWHRKLCIHRVKIDHVTPL